MLEISGCSWGKSVLGLQNMYIAKEIVHWHNSQVDNMAHILVCEP